MKEFKQAQEHREEVRKAWREIALTPNGECIIKDLERLFAPNSLIKKHGGVVDPYATLSANGAFEVISYIRSNTNE